MNDSQAFLGLALVAFVLLILHRIAPVPAMWLTAVLVAVVYALCRTTRD